jgi:hypothetical protein
MSPSWRKVLYGVMFPEYWLQGGDVSVHNRAIVSSDPRVILDTRTIFCNDVFNNWLLMLTFGLCSPVLSVAIACSVLLKMSLWTMLLGRFTRCILEDAAIDDSCTATATTSATATTATLSPSQHSQITKTSIVSVANNENRDVVHFALVALSEVHIPLFEVLAKSFWRLAWCSTVFVALLSWDIATDEVGWLKSLWVPLVPLGYVMVLRCAAYFFCNNSSYSKQTMNPTASHHEDSDVSRSPLHIEKL